MPKEHPMHPYITPEIVPEKLPRDSFLSLAAISKVHIKEGRLEPQEYFTEQFKELVLVYKVSHTQYPQWRDLRP